MAFIPIRRQRLSQPNGDGIDWSNPLSKKLAGGGIAGVNVAVRPGSAFTIGKSVGGVGGCVIGGSGNYFKCPEQVGILGRSAGGTINTAHHTVFILAENVGNGFIYDSQSDAGNNHDIKVVGGKFFWSASGTDMFAAAAPPVPSSGPVSIFAYSGQQGGAQPEVLINGVSYTGSNASQDSWVQFKYSAFFGSSAYPATNLFSGKGFVALVLKGRLDIFEKQSLTANPWQIFL